MLTYSDIMSLEQESGQKSVFLRETLSGLVGERNIFIL